MATCERYSFVALNFKILNRGASRELIGRLPIMAKTEKKRGLAYAHTIFKISFRSL